MKNKNVSFIILLIIISFLIGITFIPNVNASSSDILRYDFEKDSLIDSVDKSNMNLRHNNIITGDYNGTYSFENDNINSIPLGWTNLSTINADVKISGFNDGHNKILNMKVIDDGDAIIKQIFDDGDQISGTIEFWISTTDCDYVSTFIIYDNNAQKLNFKIENNLFQWYDGAWQELDIIPLDDIWYHIKLIFNCITDKVDIYINDYYEGNFDFQVVLDNFDEIRFNLNDNVYYETNIDAIGYSWSSNYTTNENKYPNIQEVDSNIITKDKYEFNLNDDGNPYAQIGFPDVDFWNRYSQYSYNVYPDTPDFTAKTKNINGIKILSSLDGSGTGIRNQSLGLTQDKFNITIGFQITNMDEINSYTTFTIYSLNNTEIIKLKFDTQNNQDTDLQYYDGSSYQDLVSIHGLDANRVLDFNLYIYNFSVDLSWYRTDDWTTYYSFPLISNLWGINQIHFYSYDPTSNTDYYQLRLNYIGIYQYNISMCREYGYLDYELIDDWNLNYYNVLSVNAYNQTIKIIAFEGGGLYPYYIFNEFDNDDFSYNFYSDERIFEKAHLFLIIQSSFSLIKSLSLSIQRVKLNKYIDNVFDKEITIKYYYHNLNNHSYYYVDDSNRLCYQFDITQNDTWEYMMLYFDFIPGISSDYMTIYFKCRELSLGIGSPYIAMTYYQPPDNHFYLKTYETTINTLLERGKEFRRFHFIANDKNNNNYTNYIGKGYLYGLQFDYVRYGIPGEIDFITFSLLAIMIPLIIIIAPTIGIYSVYRKKEIVIPMLLLMSIICYVALLIPFELFFIMLLCYGCGIFMQYKKGGFN